MFGAPTLVDWIGQNLRELAPWRIVRTYQRGVRFRAGIDVEELSPGWHWFVPVWESIEVVDVVSDVLNLPTQSITTKDKRTVSFSANVEFETVDARLRYTKVLDFEMSLARIAMGHIAMKAREWTWEELFTGQRDLENSLKRTLTTRAAAWGIQINEVRLTDCVVSRAYRLLGDPMV